MNDWLPVDRDPLELPLLAGQSSGIWRALIELADLHHPKWTLIGGQMVLLHALEHGVLPARVSTDLDALVNARASGTTVASAVPSFVAALNDLRFELVGASPQGIAHRYVRDDVSIDVLAPEGLGPRANLTTTAPGRTLEVPGGSQALRRTELLPVSFGDLTGQVPRPNLLGAIICKAEAVTVDDAPDAQRSDLALLLSLIGNPLKMAGEMDRKDKARIRKRDEMSDRSQPAWRTLDADAAIRGRAAYQLLAR